MLAAMRDQNGNVVIRKKPLFFSEGAYLEIKHRNNGVRLL